MARTYGVQVYPCINRKAPQNVADAGVSEGFRGVVSNWFRDGADGVFFWNLGTPFEYKTGDELTTIRARYYAALPHLGNPDEMLYRDKLYGTDGPVLNYYAHVSSTPTLPLELSEGKTVWVDFTVADDIEAAARKGRLEALKLTARFVEHVEPNQVRLQLGGKDLKIVKVAGNGAFECRLEPHLIKQGTNRFAASIQKHTAAAVSPLNLSEIRLWVRYKKRS